MMPVDHYKLIESIERATPLELAGIIQLATARLADAQPPLPKSGILRHEARSADRHSSLTIYAAGATGLRAFAGCAGQPIYKFGTTTRLAVGARLSDLSKIGYGGFDPVLGKLRAGFDDFTVAPLVRPKSFIAPRCTRLVDGCIIVDLPAGLSPSQFEDAFRKALEPHSLWTWASSREGEARLLRQNLHPTDLPGWSWVKGRQQKALELYCLKLHQATAVLCEAAASICEPRGSKT